MEQPRALANARSGVFRSSIARRDTKARLTAHDICPSGGLVSVVSGALTVKLPESDEWQTFEAGEQFTVEANKKFNVKVEVETAYLCAYGK